MTPPPSDTYKKRRNRSYWLLAIPFILAFISYQPKLGNGLVYDDEMLIVENDYAHSLSYLADHYVIPLWAYVDKHQPLKSPHTYYRPLLQNFLALNYAIYGSNPWGFHLSQILVFTTFIFSALLLTRVLTRRFFPSDKRWTIPILAVSWCAVHPAPSDAVAWISETCGLFYATFSLFALSAYIKATDFRPNLEISIPDTHQSSHHAARTAWTFAFLSAMSLFLAALGKETGVLSILLLGGWDAFLIHQRYSQIRHTGKPFKAGQLLREWVQWGWPVWIFSAGFFSFYFVLRSIALGTPLHSPGGDATLGQTLLSFPYLFGRYLLKTLAPWNPLFSSDFTPISTLASLYFWLPLVGLGILAAGIFRLRKPWLTLGAGFFTLSLLPYLYICGIRGGSLLSDRYVLLPNLAIGWLVAWVFCHLLERWKTKRYSKVALITLMACILLVFSGFVRDRLAIYKDNITFYTHVLDNAPHALLMRRNLAVELNRLGRYRESLEQIDILIDQKENFPGAWTTKGISLHNLKRFKQAEIAYVKALEFDSNDLTAKLNLGVVLENQGDWLTADELYREVLAVDPKNGIALQNSKSVRERSKALTPKERANLLCHHAHTLMKWGKEDEAERFLEEAIKMDSANPLPYQYLSKLAYLRGEINVAISNLEKAIQRDPNNTLYRKKLSVLKKQITEKK